MLLQHHLYIAAYAIAATNAAVNVYGAERPDGDYVACKAANATDDEISAALGMFYFPEAIVPGSTDLQFNETLTCDDFASFAVDFACLDLGGNATCIPTLDNSETTDPEVDDLEAKDEADAEENVAEKDSGAVSERFLDIDSNGDKGDTEAAEEEDSDGKEPEAPEDDGKDKDDDAVSERSLGNLEKRVADFCDEYTHRCWNQYEIKSGECESGYEKTYSAYRVVCVKACEKEFGDACRNRVCNDAKEYCAKYETETDHDCTTSLIRCMGSPVKMAEKSCTTKYTSDLFDEFCDKKDPACVAYKDGACTLNADQWEAFQDDLTMRTGQPRFLE